jgi:2-polyprenyl-3-methyl-5-hydroxy-6-metoxy-1,4-benzoquinol methylase
MKTSSICNLCTHADTERYLTKDNVNVVRCRHCGLIFTEKMQQHDDLIKHYSDEYFEPYLKTEAIHLKKRFRKRIEEIKCLAFPGLLLDVGCGAGFFLKLASQTGYAVKGVEISPYAVDYTRHNLGLSVFMGELGDVDFAPESFDIITLWHVLEHVRDPKAFLAQVNHLLKEKGLLAVEVPNIGSSIARCAGTKWELMAPKEHFYYFDTATLQQYLEESGFTIIKTQTFFWTTPAMLLRAVAATWKSPGAVLIKFIAFLASSLSFIRFRVAPSFLSGDVITVYALKAGEFKRPE